MLNDFASYIAVDGLCPQSSSVPLRCNPALSRACRNIADLQYQALNSQRWMALLAALIERLPRLKQIILRFLNFLLDQGHSSAI
jgi:hypothetical protein